jgi:hypothetical protein
MAAKDVAKVASEDRCVYMFVSRVHTCNKQNIKNGHQEKNTKKFDDKRHKRSGTP